MNHRGTEITERVIGAALEVHRHLGPGLLESTYEAALSHELTLTGLSFERQKALPVTYKGVDLGEAYRLDLLVEREVILELKCVEAFMPIHEAQVLSYLKLTGLSVGLLINFKVPLLKQGIKRIML